VSVHKADKRVLTLAPWRRVLSLYASGCMLAMCISAVFAQLVSTPLFAGLQYLGVFLPTLTRMGLHPAYPLFFLCLAVANALKEYLIGKETRSLVCTLVLLGVATLAFLLFAIALVWVGSTLHLQADLYD